MNLIEDEATQYEVDETAERIQTALAHLSRALDVGADGYRFMEIGDELSDLGLDDEARVAYQAAVELMPDSAEAWYRVGRQNSMTLIETGSEDEHLNRILGESVTAIRRSLLIEPQHIPALRDISTALMLMGNCSEALEYLLRWRSLIELEETEQLVDLYFQTGLAYLFDKQHGAATDEFKRIIELNPRQPEGFLGIGLVAVQAELYDVCDQQIERLRILDTDLAELLTRMKSRGEFTYRDVYVLLVYGVSND